jgi:AbrB family looped-hinge helix DNA binding protein
VTSKGQITIPAEIRERFGFLPDTEVEFIVEGDTVMLIRSSEPGASRGERIVSRLRGRATTGLSTDEIMALTRES